MNNSQVVIRYSPGESATLLNTKPAKRYSSGHKKTPQSTYPYGVLFIQLWVSETKVKPGKLLKMNLMVQNSNSLLQDLRRLNQLKNTIVQNDTATSKNGKTITSQLPVTKKQKKAKAIIFIFSSCLFLFF